MAFVAATLTMSACDTGTTPLGGFDDAGCNDDATEGDTPGADSAADGPAEDEGIAVDCSFSFEGEVQTARYNVADGELPSPPPLEFGDALIVEANVFDPDFEVRSFSITVYTEDGALSSTTLYQIAPGTLPVNEFFGQHGFTGLRYVNEPGTTRTLQFACFARTPADPISGWEDDG
ncbi:MAG: hypothetical protein AAF799_20930 [Myxococcota bacterium]